MTDTIDKLSSRLVLVIAIVLSQNYLASIDRLCAWSCPNVRRHGWLFSLNTTTPNQNILCVLAQLLFISLAIINWVHLINHVYKSECLRGQILADKCFLRVRDGNSLHWSASSKKAFELLILHKRRQPWAFCLCLLCSPVNNKVKQVCLLHCAYPSLAT